MLTLPHVLLRLWRRPLPGLALIALLVVRFALQMGHPSGVSAAITYVVAFGSVALALAVSASAEQATWSRGSSYSDLLLVLSIAILILLEQATWVGLLLLDQAPDAPNPLVTLHLAAGALAARRIPASRPARCLAFLLAMSLIPALLPALRPVLDPNSRLHETLFSRPLATLAPILTLVVIALALPSPSVRTEATSS